MGTGRLYGRRRDWWVDERADIIKSTQAAAHHLKDLHEKFSDWNLVMAAYNAGPRKIERALKRYGPMDYWTMVKRRLLPRETRNFVPSILAAMIIFRNPERYGFNVEPDEPIQFETVNLREQVDLRIIADEIDVSVAELLEFNPELRRGISPFDYEDYQLKVPLGKGDLLTERLASLPPEKKVQFRHHKVRGGETLSVISRKYSSSIQAIAQVNRIRNIHRLREGQDLIIPLSSSLSARISKLNLELPANYVVRRGDSLAKIARRYGVTVKDLLRWNNLKVNGIIYPGQTIRILAETESVANQSSQGTDTTGDR